MCEHTLAYSTITAFKPLPTCSQTPNKWALELSSWPQLHCTTLKQVAVISPWEFCADVTLTATLTSDSHHRWPTNSRAMTTFTLAADVFSFVWQWHPPKCYFRDYPVYRGLLCTQGLTQGFEMTWSHLQTSTHQTLHTNTKYIGRRSYTAV